MYEWKRSSGRRTGGFGALCWGAGAPEPKERPLPSSVVLVFWPNSEKPRVFLSSFDSVTLEATGRAATRERALVWGPTLEACEHRRHTKEAADRMAGSIARVEVLALEMW